MSSLLVLQMVCSPPVDRIGGYVTRAAHPFVCALRLRTSADAESSSSLLLRGIAPSERCRMMYQVSRWTRYKEGTCLRLQRNAWVQATRTCGSAGSLRTCIQKAVACIVGVLVDHHAITIVCCLPMLHVRIAFVYLECHAHPHCCDGAASFWAFF